MATTKYKLAEECLRILNGGNNPDASKFHIEEIKIAVEQVGNQMLKMQFLNTNLPMGDLIPSGAAIATYENNKVVKYKNTSKTTLPCFPLTLPRNLGVYQIFPPEDMYAEFIPMELGQAALIRSNPIVNDLSGCIGYECAGLDVLFNKDITDPNTDKFVTIRLVVLDFSQYDDYSILPLSPEYEFQIKSAVLQMYNGEIIADKLADPSVKEQRGNPTSKQNQA